MSCISLEPTGQLPVPFNMNSNGGPLIVRADANVAIGMGHVMRCIALAQAWQDSGGSVTFVMAGDSESIESRLLKEKISVLNIESNPGSLDDAIELVGFAGRPGVAWIVIDGYHFCTEYQREIKKAGMKLLCLDDYGHCKHYFADIVLNQNVNANERTYKKREPYTRLLLGTRYALLRREFIEYRDWKRRIPAQAKNILVTMGGSDTDNVTARVLGALECIQDVRFEVVVAVGGSNSHFSSLIAQAKGMAHSVQIKKDVQDMPALMAWADLAIAAGGSTCWEIAYMDLPAVLIVLADNQREIASGLGEAGFAVDLGWHENVVAKDIETAVNNLIMDIEKRRRISKMGREIVDSLGSGRVVELLMSAIKE